MRRRIGSYALGVLGGLAFVVALAVSVGRPVASVVAPLIAAVGLVAIALWIIWVRRPKRG